MKVSRVIVQYRGGAKASHMKVQLGFIGFLKGMSRPVYTDRDGVAVIEHSSSGEADVYVSGRRIGRLRAPGETVVFL